MIEIKGILEKFEKQGEKSGWTYLRIPAVKASAISKIKTIDDCPLSQIAILPMGEGDFILPVNQEMRKAIRKSKGAAVVLRLQYDPSLIKPDDDFLECLAEFPASKTYFLSLTQGHKNYFTKWLSTAKTEQTKSNRIALAIDALSRGMGFGEMLREKKAN